MKKYGNKMKLKLNKKKLKNLSKDNNALPADMTPLIGGASPVPSGECTRTLDCPIEIIIERP